MKIINVVAALFVRMIKDLQLLEDMEILKDSGNFQEVRLNLGKCQMQI